MDLKSRTCEPCKGGVPPLSKEAAQAMLDAVPGWELNRDATRLSRHFSFGNFIEAQTFALKVGELAEAEGHHPVLNYTWGYCDVLFYTHKIGGLHENDFIMAAKVSALA
ncbi:MAG: pterin-4-alpha-carbinolamine dehydratase [Zetaproteobacteria bacterium CG06_land_8_20_14_3_00_59_53]|nr:MAG: pterin-4-alpha-carbinolamine dehydratase [Zetaproteobacteria bacterium CG2_30_59_37]PIO89190.1 MAG: pterin-4-alpha-carbinolamine dehydratase [Zetaproteobacteria bacterium CG23_combo_of_CG06-09_8_20_14_all_59_86]PIQ64503.1 MAG: pterin-4-alpha-carbinolamine dehydratase [Zetaproteobacteria bacterium CG11_big_fil_rev_8_21_14_0_20_59_439]PIU70929.1 MAG: pterin-4-alpha-carbinolamine dehydratase [Zetaproteobacteria bacterium CG06_land_8_20_14_3_00_59_53]PIU96334.1 MAG: pterin-4-alpha-carbinola